jgi:antirestriction protein
MSRSIRAQDTLRHATSRKAWSLGDATAFAELTFHNERLEMTTTTTSPRIYVADLAAYNSGILHGVWIDLEGMTLDEVNEQVGEMLKEGHRLHSKETLSFHEEWAIHDHEGFGEIYIGEYESLARVVAHAEHLTEDVAGKYQAWINAKGEAEGFDHDEVFGPYESPDEWLDQEIDSRFGTLDLQEILEKAGIGRLYNYIEWRDAASYQRNVTGSETGILTEVSTGQYSVEFYEVAE